MRNLIATTLLCLFFASLKAQESNPLINSGELIEKAVGLHDEGKYKESIELYKKVSRGDTNYYRVVYELALSQMMDSQYAAAKQTCEIGLAVPNEWWPPLYTLYGNIVDDMGDHETAVRIYDSAIVRYPAYTELNLNKGTTLIILNRYAEAEEVFKQCILINPYQASSHYKLGVCAMQQGQVVQAMLSFINYLLLQPQGRYQKNCISALSKISKAGDDIKEAIGKRTGEQGENFALIERIIMSKIALDKQYKPLLKLDDQISRQIQVVFEKLEYDENDPDFWMQYYVPLFKQIFDEKKFEPFVNYLFTGVKIDVIQDYIKKNKKDLENLENEAVIYYNQIRATREQNYAKRKDMGPVYHYDNGKLIGKGNTKDNGETLAGDWEFYYSAGNLSSKGRYNDKSERTGPWQYYHFNGLLKGKRNYVDGKLEGVETFYFDNGVMSSSDTYKNDKEEGESKRFYRIGVPRSIAHFASGKMNGERRAFFSTGSLQLIENYKEDSLDGPFKTFYKTGPLESQGTYINGKLSGPYKSYHDNGKLSMEGAYKDGKLSGPWKQYHENGKLKVLDNYADGLIEGDYTEYYDNGQLFYKCVYKKGKVSGDVEYLDRDGKRFFIYTFDKDVTKAASFFDKSGKEIGRSERKAKRFDLTTYFTDGTKRSQAVYNDQGETIGTETYYYHSGKTSSENGYEDGQLSGPGINYYPNGQKQALVVYKEGEKHGYEKFWYSHGQLESEGWYQDGMLQGTWKNYDELGNLDAVTEYLNDDLNGYKQEFFPNGKLSYETRYKLGWIEEFIQYDTMGKEISRSIIKNGNGKFKVVFFNGKTYGEGTYVNGELDGPYKFYYFDGKLNTLQFYDKGNLDSIYRNYYYDGKIATEGQYKSGKKEGTWKNYFESGKLHYVENYVDGELEGKKIYYHENGKVNTEMEMERGERNGWTKNYDEDGSFMYQVNFLNDLPISYTYFDKTGKLVPEITIPANTGRVKTYYANGNVSAEFGYADGKVDGVNAAYHSNGKIAMQGVEDYGLSEKTYKYYYANGKLQYEYNYLHNNLHGFYKEYNEQGILKEEGNYYNDLPHDIMKVYDDAGKLKETRIYYYGKLLEIKK